MAARFEYPFQSRHATVDGVRLHYLDEGTGPVVWLMHGMPMWSYVWRKLIPPLVAAGYRVFAPDPMGFGLSDKPGEEKAHTLQRHVALMTGLIEQLGLKDIIVAGQDWGGPIALRYAIEHKNCMAWATAGQAFSRRGRRACRATAAACGKACFHPRRHDAPEVKCRAWQAKAKRRARTS
jgi:pimeloyl-ACP methyl ester carboxylesterase